MGIFCVSKRLVDTYLQTRPEFCVIVLWTIVVCKTNLEKLECVVETHYTANRIHTLQTHTSSPRMHNTWKWSKRRKIHKYVIKDTEDKKRTTERFDTFRKRSNIWIFSQYLRIAWRWFRATLNANKAFYVNVCVSYVMTKSKCIVQRS